MKSKNNVNPGTNNINKRGGGVLINAGVLIKAGIRSFTACPSSLDVYKCSVIVFCSLISTCYRVFR